MVAVLAAVLVMTASIWIAIYLEPRLGMLPTRATLARASQPACCRFRNGAAKPAVRRPVRCTQGVRAEAGEVVTAESGFVHGKHPHALVVYRKADG